jgi:hypothetical protein
MIRMRRLFSVVAAGLLAGAPSLVAQADTPNPFGVPRAERQQDERFRGDRPRWHRGRHLERRDHSFRGGRWEHRGERFEHRGERFEHRGQRFEHRGERFERRGERMHRHHRHRFEGRRHARRDGRI